MEMLPQLDLYVKLKMYLCYQVNYHWLSFY